MILAVEVVRVTCQPIVLAVAAVCVFSTDQLIVFCVKQALRRFGFCVKQALKGGVFTIDLHVSFQKKCEFYNGGGGAKGNSNVFHLSFLTHSVCQYDVT